jgi:hypothetical protein
MTVLQIQFWRGRKRLYSDSVEEFSSLETATRHIDNLLHSMVWDAHFENWTGCRIRVVTESGKPVLEVPILPAMSNIARRTHLEPIREAESVHAAM